MNDIQKRFLLFIFGCITSRLLLVFISKNINNNYLPYISIITLTFSLGFTTIYLGNYRKTGGEVMGGKIWWNDIRPIHASLYILFSLFALKKKSYSWIILLIDAIFGLFVFLYHYYINNYFSMLL
tara:strand:+ start:2181 stop:2555 length:375 start_codon:yes stop_codon:yes gene_type:complete